MRWWSRRRPAPSAATEHKVALIHAVEGGFTWARTPSAWCQRAPPRGLGRRDVTLAHLFWRDVRTNWLRRCRSCRTGSTRCCSAAIPWPVDLGRRRSTLVGRTSDDVTYMSQRAAERTFARPTRSTRSARLPVVGLARGRTIRRPALQLARRRAARHRGRRACGVNSPCKHYMSTAV